MLAIVVGYWLLAAVNHIYDRSTVTLQPFTILSSKTMNDR
jgi:hypothetical protein